jgi:hypothetical protein
MPDTIIGAVAPAVTAFVLAKIGEISAEQRRSRFLQQHLVRIGFWQMWVQAQTLVCTAEQLESVKETARLQLDAIQLEMSAFAQASPRIDPPASRIRRWLLLYGVNRPMVWLPRIAFYLFLTYAGLLVAQVIIDPNLRSGLMFPVALSVLVLVLFLGLWSRTTAIQMENRT